MEQLKVRFTVQVQEVTYSFSTMSDLERLPIAEPVMHRVLEFEARMKQAAAIHWLHHQVGPDKMNSLHIRLVR